MIGVQVEVADAKEKSLPASLRSAQQSCSYWLGDFSAKDEPRSRSLRALCERAQKSHEIEVQYTHSRQSGRKTDDRTDQWMSLPMKVPGPTVAGELDWEPGPWLRSWEASVPPDHPRYLKLGGLDGCTWMLVSGRAHVPEDDFEFDDYWEESADSLAAEYANFLVACWPNPPAEVAKYVGITLRELKWFMSGKAVLDRSVRGSLEYALGIGYDPSEDRYRPMGPYALMAKKADALMSAYDEITFGGDASPFEIVPRRGPADPSWRYVLINPHCEEPSIAMVPRGSKIWGKLPGLLLNYEGTEAVDPVLYRSAVAACAQACREPAANIREMRKFAKIYERFRAEYASDLS